MKHIQAAAVAVAISALTAGVGGQIIAGPTVTKPRRPTVGALALPQARGVLENIPKASLFLGLRMLNGKMYAMNGSGGTDVDVTPRIVMGPLQHTPRMRGWPLPAPLLPKKPQVGPHRR